MILRLVGYTLYTPYVVKLILIYSNHRAIIRVHREGNFKLKLQVKGVEYSSLPIDLKLSAMHYAPYSGKLSREKTFTNPQEFSP